MLQSVQNRSNLDQTILILKLIQDIGRLKLSCPIQSRREESRIQYKAGQTQACPRVATSHQSLPSRTRWMMNGKSSCTSRFWTGSKRTTLLKLQIFWWMLQIRTWRPMENGSVFISLVRSGICSFFELLSVSSHAGGQLLPWTWHQGCVRQMP